MVLAANHRTGAGQMPLHLISARHYMGDVSTVISIGLKFLPLQTRGMHHFIKENNYNFKALGLETETGPTIFCLLPSFLSIYCLF